MLIPTRYITYAVICILCFVLGYFARSSETPEYQPVVDAKMIVAKTDTIFVRDTIYATRWKVKYDSIRDTLNITDTVQVKEYVRVADSTIVSCQRALASCAVALKARDTVIVTQDRYIEKVSKPKSSIRDLLIAAGVGALTTHYLKGR